MLLVLITGMNTHAQRSSNSDIRSFYYDLVLQDSIRYATLHDSLIKKQMSRHYNSLAWYSILMQNFDSVEYYLTQSIRYDPLSPYPYSNFPLFFLLTHQYKKAKMLYLKYKDLPFDSHRTYKEEFLTDFQELERVGITNRNIKKITRLLTRP